MKMQAKLLMTCGILGLPVALSAQYAAESMAAINMNNTMNAGPAAPGMVAGQGNPGGFQAPMVSGNAMPGQPMDPAMMDPTMGGDPSLMAGYGGQAGAVMTPAATPIPTANVMTGRRVYDAVSGGLLEDAIEIAVRQGDVDAYPDDGVRDNGIAGDGIRGNVETLSGQYIGLFSNSVKNHLVHAVSNAENIDPMIYYGYHVAKLDPKTEGPKRYGRALPEEADDELMVTRVADMPNVLDLEEQRDELVRKWNQDFLAQYRVVPEDPQSSYYPVFVPAPPLTPMNYPVPNGYVSPQSVAKTNKQQTDAQVAAQVATQAAAGSSARGGGASELTGM